ncbi:MAG: hypothetical protein RhofKO_39440 [Rhodothermales bacterium]
MREDPPVTALVEPFPDTLSGALETLLPAHFGGDTLPSDDPEALRSFLQQFYLFEVGGLTLTDDVVDAWQFVQEQFRTALSAAQLHGLTVATALTGDRGRTRLYVGVLADKAGAMAFCHTLTGVLPGLNVRSEEELQFDSLLRDKPYGGTVAGVPTLRADDERQRFGLHNVARALRASSFTLAIVSRPVGAERRTARTKALLDARDWCHEQAKQTLGKQHGTSKTVAENESKSQTKGFAVSGGAAGAGVGLVLGGPAGAIIGGIIGSSLSYNSSESKSSGSSTSRTEQLLSSLTHERQNGLALELEQVADHHLQRLKRAASVGLWETSVAFAAASEESANVLAGAFAAELAKPNELGVPPRVVTQRLSQDGLLPVSLVSESSHDGSSLVTSEELALISAPPTEVLPGYEVRRMPRLSLTDPTPGPAAQRLGDILDHGTRLESSPFVLGAGDLAKHVFVCGLTGSGKSTTVKQILKGIHALGSGDSTPFLVLESAKRDYRRLLADPAFADDLRVYTVGDATVSPLRLNPFFVLPGASVAWHLDFLKALFQASFSFYGPMPAILEKCLGRVYTRRGWDLTVGVHPHLHDEGGEPRVNRFYSPEGLRCFPVLEDLKQEVDDYIRNDLQYRGELSDNIRTAMLVRLDSLCSGAKGLMLNTHETVPMEDLLSSPTVLELEPLADDDDKAFLVGLILLLVSEYRQLSGPAADHRRDPGLRHVLVLEEAHRLLKNVSTERQSEMMGNPKGKAVETFCNVVAEMRSLGQGVVVVEQVPSKIAPDVLKNTSTKLAHRIVSGDDQSLLASTLGLSLEEASYLSLLETGRALCHKEGMSRPAEVAVRTSVEDRPIVHEKVRRHMRAHAHSRESLHLPTFAAAVRSSGRRIVLRLLNTLLVGSKEQVLEGFRAAEAELSTACARAGVSYVKDTSQLYLHEEMLNIIGRGVYSRGFRWPEQIWDTLGSVLNVNPSSAALVRLRTSMAAHYGAEDAEAVVVEGMTSLLLAYAARADRRLSDVDLAAEARSLFAHVETKTATAIVTSARHRLEVLYAAA